MDIATATQQLAAEAAAIGTAMLLTGAFLLATIAVLFTIAVTVPTYDNAQPGEGSPATRPVTRPALGGVDGVRRGGGQET